MFVYVADEFAGQLIESSEGVLKWIDDGQLVNLDLWAGDLIFLPWLEHPGFFSGKFVYLAGRLVSHSAVFYDSPLQNILGNP